MSHHYEEDTFQPFISLPEITDGPNSLEGTVPEIDTSESDLIKQVEKDYPETCTEFKKIQQQQYLLFCKKQSDYGPNNISLGSMLQEPDEVHASLCGIIFKLHDKVQRLMNLVVKKGNKTTPVNESIEDAFLDLSNYGIMANIVKRQKWGK